MTTVPASQFVTVNPGVLAAGGNEFDLVSMWLSVNTRIPVGTILNFTSSAAVLAYFGAGTEYSHAQVYFAGYQNATKLPGSLNFVQYPVAPASAYLRGGNISGLTLSQLQAISGSLDVMIDGYAFNAASVNLSSDSSFSAAAATIATALNAGSPSPGTATGAITAQTASVTASIDGNVVYVTAVASGTLIPGAPFTGTGVTSGSILGNQISGTTGGIGTYSVNKAQVVASTTLSFTYGLMNITVDSATVIAVGQIVTGSGVTANTQIIGLDSGTGGDGSYYVNLTQSVISESLTFNPAPCAVTYDSTAGAFVITSGSTGTTSSVAFATGTIAATLMLTSATGAVMSQGAVAQTPSAFMTALVASNENWATFLTQFDPDGTNSGAFTQKLAFAQWVNSTDEQFAYIAVDTSSTPTVANPATGSFGYAVNVTYDYSGTILCYEPSPLNIAAFIAGMIASIDFEATNGRITGAFKYQTGLAAGVTSQTVLNNLVGNGYNSVVASANANNGWTFLFPGSISGPYDWLDTYVNQIWLNNAFQTTLMGLLTTINSIPYNQDGYTIIEESLSDDISAALNCGVIRAGVPLSALQSLEVNQAAGQNITSVLQTQGWYLQVLPASASVRQARQSPPINFWYTDGESIQQLTIASIVLQ